MTDTRKAFEEAREHIKAANSGQFRGEALRMVDEMEELVLDNPDDTPGSHRRLLREEDRLGAL